MKIDKEDIVERFGSIRKLALLMDIAPQSLYQREYFAENHCFKIEKLSEGKFKFKDLLEVKLKSSPVPRYCRGWKRGGLLIFK